MANRYLGTGTPLESSVNNRERVAYVRHSRRIVKLALRRLPYDGIIWSLATLRGAALARAETEDCRRAAG